MGPADVLRDVIHQLFQKRGILDGGSLIAVERP
jgi:hypothetical protein